MFKKTVLVLAVLLVAAQFIRPAKNLGAVVGPNDLNAKYPVPPAVKTLLARACYDCHSNHTRYPWYAEVQPVGWWLSQHVNDGRRHLNFSEFGAYPEKRAAKKLEQVSDEVDQHTMPLSSYTWVHADARLTSAETKLLVDWADSLHDKINGP